MNKRWWMLLVLGWGVVSGAEEPRPTPYSDQLITQSREQNLSSHRFWQVLLHRRASLLGRQQSDIDDPAFFLSPRGRQDAQAELEATLRAFFAPPADDAVKQHPQCQFPTRYAWLKEQLHFDPQLLPEQACPRYETWKSRMNPGSVSVIFASYYMNNPSSMYGHTFLRLNAVHHNDQQRLLDYAINYGADVRGNNGLLFAVYGLTGHYRGNFASLPYYIKVQEYNNLESRDLWEYPLTFSQDQLDRLVSHLWEMGSGTMAYYFLNKNCSYALLPLLEVADPSLHLKEKFVFKAIPIDTLRQILAQPGLPENRFYRPSHVSQMLARRSLLSREEVSLAEKLVKGSAVTAHQALEKKTPERQAAVLDAAYDLFRYRVGFKKPQPDAVMNKEQELLLWRNQAGLQAGATIPKPVIAEPSSPETGHLSSQIRLSGGSFRKEGFVEWSVRPSLHDPVDSPRGYLPGTQLEMVHLKARYVPSRNTFYVSHFSLIDLLSMSPQDRWIHPMSWKLNTGVRIASDLDKDPEHAQMYGGTLGTGLSVHLFGIRSLLAFAMADADVGIGKTFGHYYRLGGGVEGGVLWHQGPRGRMRFVAEQLWYPTGDRSHFSRLSVEQGVDVARRIQLRATMSRVRHNKEAMGTVAIYF